MKIPIVIGDRETIHQALKRFKQKLKANNLAWEIRRRSYPTDKVEERRIKIFQKRLKARRATLIAQMNGEQPADNVQCALERFQKRSGKP